MSQHVVHTLVGVNTFICRWFLLDRAELYFRASCELHEHCLDYCSNKNTGETSKPDVVHSSKHNNGGSSHGPYNTIQEHPSSVREIQEAILVWMWHKIFDIFHLTLL